MKLTISELTRRAVVLEGQKVSINIAQGREFVRCLSMQIIEAIDSKETTELELLNMFSKYLEKLRGE